MTSERDEFIERLAAIFDVPVELLRTESLNHWTQAVSARPNPNAMDSCPNPAACDSDGDCEDGYRPHEWPDPEWNVKDDDDD